MIALLVAQEQAPQGGLGAVLVPLLLIGAAMYFLMIRPQQKRARSQRELARNLEIGDEVMTAGGIFGVIRDADDEMITVEISPGTNVRMLRQGIARRLTEPDEAGDGETE